MNIQQIKERLSSENESFSDLSIALIGGFICGSLGGLARFFLGAEMRYPWELLLLFLGLLSLLFLAIYVAVAIPLLCISLNSNRQRAISIACFAASLAVTYEAIGLVMGAIKLIL